VGWHCGAATQRAGVERCACIGPPSLHTRVHLSAPLRLSVRAYSERERETGWRGGGGAEPTVPSRGPNQGRQRMTHVLGNCIRRLTYLCAVSVATGGDSHLIRRTDRDNAERTAVDIKAHTPLI